MNKFMFATALVLSATAVNAKTIYYPKDACTDILSAEYSTGGGDSSFQMYEILCKDANGKYKSFVTSWASASGFFGLGRVFYEEEIDLVPYDGKVLSSE